MAENAIDIAYKLGQKYETTYRGCGQCAVAAIQDALSIKDNGLFKAATGLSAGGGSCVDGSCGAYVGAIMVLSSMLGRDRDKIDDIEVINRNRDLVKEFRSRYIDEYGSVVCHNIQTKVLGRPYYLADMDERQKFDAAGGHDDSHCSVVVAKAASWMAEIILKEKLLK